MQYREMGDLRSALPEVPFMACTATATPAVQSDIVSNLHLKPSAKRCTPNGPCLLISPTCRLLDSANFRTASSGYDAKIGNSVSKMS